MKDQVLTEVNQDSDQLELLSEKIKDVNKRINEIGGLDLIEHQKIVMKLSENR